SVHFDGNVMPHYHFQCTECGAIIDLDFNDSKPEKALVSAAANQFDGIIEGSVSFSTENVQNVPRNKNRNYYYLVLTNIK
ncbi:MAG: hypothetical protein J6N21_14645, partial [Butyrivibrio sp.]|nr:hypothetical protein [Butyrivibrio sp.]